MAILSAHLAHRQKRNPYFWFAIGFFLGLIGILAFFFIPKQSAAVVQVPSLKGPTDKWWYYLDAENKQQGPMSFDAMNRAWRDGKAKIDTYVWHEELPEWKPLKEFLKD